MSVMRDVWRGTGPVLAGQLLARGGSFLANVIIFHILAESQVGQLGLIETWIGFASVLSLFGVGAGLQRYVALHDRHSRQLAARYMIAGYALGLLSTSLVALMAYSAFTVPNLLAGPTPLHALAQYKDLLVLLTAAVTFRGLTYSAIYGYQRYGALLPSNLAVGLLTIPLYAVAVSKAGLYGVLWARVILALIESGVLLTALWPEFASVRSSISLTALKEPSLNLVRFSIPTLGGHLLQTPIVTFMVSLVAARGGLAQVALITAAGRIVGLASFAPGAMSLTLIPILSRRVAADDGQGLGDSAVEATRALWVTSLPVTVGLIALGPTLPSFIYGAPYASAWSVTVLLLLYNFLSSLNEPADRVLLAANRQWLSTSLNLAWTALFLAIGYVLVPRFFAMGYGVAYVLSFLPYLLLQLIVVRRLLSTSLSPLASISVVSALALPLSYLMGRILPPQLAWPAAPLTVAVVLALQWHTLLSHSERTHILNLVSGARMRVTDILTRPRAGG